MFKKIKLLLGGKSPNIEIVVTTSSQSIERAASLLPMNGSENARHLLKFPEGKKRDTTERKDYLPDDFLYWILDLESEGALPNDHLAAAKSTLGDQFEIHCEYYSVDPTKNQWTYGLVKNCPKALLAVDLKPNLTTSQSPDRDTLQAFLENAENLFAPQVKIKPRINIDAAFAQAQASAELKLDLEDTTSWVVACAREGEMFSGRDIWDLMLCLGYRWGDMDCFHLDDFEAEDGDDSIVSVQTSTDPGYFLPKVIAEGGNYETLMFNFSIPRSRDPEAAFDCAVASARYVVDKLGGNLLNVNGEQFVESSERKNVLMVIQKLKNAGFNPGESRTLQLL